MNRPIVHRNDRPSFNTIDRTVDDKFCRLEAFTEASLATNFEAHFIFLEMEKLFYISSQF